MFEFIIGAVLLVLAVWAIANILNSGADTGAKIIWILVVLIFPILGVLAWYFFGPKSALK